MKTIIAQNKKHLDTLIIEHIKQFGNDCDLNHIDVSQITNMSCIFVELSFNGDISKWDTSNVTDMSFMFNNSQFNQDISQWNTGNVTNMSHMFRKSLFN